MQLPAVQTKFLNLPNSFSLRNGATLDKVCVAYEQYGTLTPEKDNAILLFHALSGSQHAYGYNPEVPGTGSLWKPENHEGWWNSIIGPGKPLDTDRFCIICANYLGGCYGTTGPATPCPADGQPYGSRFPHVEIADQARLQALQGQDYILLHKSSIMAAFVLTSRKPAVSLRRRKRKKRRKKKTERKAVPEKGALPEAVPG